MIETALNAVGVTVFFVIILAGVLFVLFIIGIALHEAYLSAKYDYGRMRHRRETRRERRREAA
jgi:hypothetical protein